MKKENKLWTKNTNIKEKDLECPDCTNEMDIFHSSNHHNGTGIFYVGCDCGRELNVSFSIN